MLSNIHNSELVLGLIYTVGTQIDDLSSVLKDVLRQYHYTLEEISVSKDIISQFESSESHFENEHDRITHYMNLGNKIRQETDDNSILMKGVAKELYLRRLDDTESPQPRERIAYLIKSIKHPDEVSFLRQTYGDGFHLIGVTSQRERRLNYLKDIKGMTSEDANQLIERDSNEDFEQGQHTRDAFQHADYFVDITEDRDRTQNQIKRLIELLFGNPFITPTFDEYAMFMAYATSLRSADLSRQVGAAIARDNVILSMGTNDCPKFGGGLYWPFDEKHDGKAKYVDSKDGRDYMRGYDSNKTEQAKLITSILENLGMDSSDKKLISKVKKAGISDLTEFGRVVHGEMDAILTCARNQISCKDATMYVTTFPCHNCAKHIIASGIKRVIYIEPYPKSKAFEFHPAEITDDCRTSDKVVFEPFTGVGPQRYADLFSMISTKWYKRNRKDSSGEAITWGPDKAELRTPISPFNYMDSEASALLVFEEETKALKGAIEDE